MRICSLYADHTGETHFRDVEIALTEAGPDGTTSRLFPAKGVIFRTTPGDRFFDWHPANRRQYVVNLDAPHQVQASDGETRIIGAGRDLSGRGRAWKRPSVAGARPVSPLSADSDRVSCMSQRAPRNERSKIRRPSIFGAGAPGFRFTQPSYEPHNAIPPSTRCAWPVM
jgi:hypothetical protein